MAFSAKEGHLVAASPIPDLKFAKFCRAIVRVPDAMKIVMSQPESYEFLLCSYVS